MVTHFSLGSFLLRHGWSTSPFRTLLEWKKREGIPRTAEDEPNDDGGLEVSGVPNGLVFPRGAGEMSSPNGSRLLSGVPGRIGVVAAETADTPLPL